MLRCNSIDLGCSSNNRTEMYNVAERGCEKGNTGFYRPNLLRSAECLTSVHAL